MQNEIRNFRAARDAGHTFSKGFRISVSAGVIATIGFTGTVNAKPALTIRERQHLQELRLEAAAREGKLTKVQIETLQQSHDEIWDEIRADKADGHLTPAEKASLQAQLDSLSRLIYENAHPSNS